METTPLLSRSARRPLLSRLRNCFYFKRKDVSPRYIELGELPTDDFPKNTIRNQKYNVITFLPIVLFQQFKYFLNLYFLIMALSQFIPNIRIGYLYTYWGPLCFVLTVTLFREAVDDIRRYRRDKEVNTQQYERVALDKDTKCCSLNYETQRVPASAIRVGDIVILQKGQRVPADMILLRTNEIIGTVFLRTDQLDGETDWKLRIPVSSTQKLEADSQLLNVQATVFVEKPQQDIHSFVGTWTRLDEEEIDSLDIENTLWSGCVVASGQATGLVIYTGSETRSVMNNEMPRSKVGQLDLQVNDLTKVLFVAVMFLSFLMIVLKSFSGPWYRFMFRFVLLFSYIIPISLRVNLDMGKAFYSWAIQRDKKIEGTVMRSTTIPEELGRIKYLLADKTGTLTKNEMVFQRLHLEKISFDQTAFHEVETLLTQCVTKQPVSTPPASPTEEVPEEPYPRRIWETVLALALCHNVTPVYQIPLRGGEPDDSSAMGSDMVESVVSESCGGSVPQQQLCDYQASSPDEVALVKWTDMMGVSLYHRDLHSISLKVRATNNYRHYNILQIFPFTSETKMMGIIVEDIETEEIVYYVKGADVALSPLLAHPEWLKRESSHLASEGLRTLGVAKSMLTRAEYTQFESDYKEARLSVTNRGERTAAAMSRLQSRLTLLAVTGVEDRLADNVSHTLQLVRGAGIKLTFGLLEPKSVKNPKVWMLTGDKLETALCIARSLHLNGALGTWEIAGECRSRHDLHNQLQLISQTCSTSGLIIGGDTLEMCVNEYPDETMSALVRCACVVVARCSPTQKAGVAKLLRARGLAVCAVGDGGNDVAMIQQANIGVGIEGAEGRAASLAGDVSVRQFSALARLLLVHGRRAYMRSAALSLFIVHRGLIISTMQAVFSCVFYFSSVSLYPGFLMVGYGTFFTVLPVFSLVLDRDIPSAKALNHPGLYKQLSKGRALSYKTFWIWTAISIYQGGVIMFGALVMFEDELIHIVAISYSALILTELIMVALTIDTWHRLMIVAEVISFILYIITLCWFNEYFDADFLKKWDFMWKVFVITAVSCLPLYVVKFTHKIIVSKQTLVEPIA